MKSLYSAIYTIAATCLLMACAQIRGLDGGKKDETPANILAVDPPIFTTNFLPQKIRIDFDEYVQLNNIIQELIISPPLQRPVKTTIRKKSIFIELQEPLLENTTYTFNFGEAIADLREGNTTAFIYVISTGNEIDSLVIKGDAKMARTALPAAGARVMLYKDMEKGHVLNENPAYFGKVEADGTFEIQYLAPGDYQLVVLDDADGNYHLDEGENIAFVDHLVPASIDDSLMTKLHVDLSKNRPERPFVSEYKADSLGVLRFPFNELFGLTSPKVLSDENVDLTTAFNPGRDSIYVWLKGEAIDKEVIVQLSWRDSVLDTLEIPFYKERQQMQWAIRPQSGRKIRSGEPLKLCANGWTEIHNTDAFIVKEDSVSIPVTVERDSIWPAQFLVRGKWKTGKNYELLVLPDALMNGSGKGNDTLKFSFTIFKPEDFGQVTIEISGPTDNSMFIEFENSKSDVVFHGLLNQKGIQAVQDLEAGEYTARIIQDTNNNSRWDEVSYEENIQPEKMWVYPGKINVRSNWEIKLKWPVEN